MAALMSTPDTSYKNSFASGLGNSSSQAAKSSNISVRNSYSSASKRLKQSQSTHEAEIRKPQHL